MKKFRIILFLAFFIICSFSGYALANLIQQWFSTTATVSTLTPIPLTSQQNLLIIHSTSLQPSQGRLKTVWIVFISMTDPPNILFKPIFPSAQYQNSNQLFQAFSISPDGEPSSAFLEVLRSLDFNQNGTILVDDGGLSAIISWITGSPNDVISNKMNDPGYEWISLENEVILFEKICEVLSKSEQVIRENPPWSILIPDHFHTNLEFNRIAYLWDKITRPVSQVKCKVLTK